MPPWQKLAMPQDPDGQLLGLKRPVEVLQPGVHVRKLGVDGSEPAVDLPSDVVDLLGHQGHQFG